MLRLLWLFWLLFETAPGEEEEESPEDEEQDEDIRDPKAKRASMQDHIDRLHRRVEERDSRIKALEGSGDGQEGQLENAFLRAVIAAGKPIALDDAWELARLRGFLDPVTVTDEGEVSGMDEALSRLFDRYPWLADADAQPADPPPPLPKTGGAKRKTGEPGIDHSRLEQRFPALKGRGRGGRRSR